MPGISTRVVLGHPLLLVSLLGSLTLPACSAGTQGQEEAGEGAQADQAPPPSAQQTGGNQLLVEARHSMVSGSVSPELRQQILASDDPAHARARRILEGMEREDAVIPDAEEAQGKAPSAVPQGDDVPQIRPPDPDIEPTTVKTDGSAAPREASSDEGGAESGEAQAPSAAKLSVLTRLTLAGSPQRVTLRLNAADRVVMGMAEQPQSGMLRLVVESAGALPGFLQARPEAHGVRVTDVRRGTDTVQISIQMDPGWRPQGPRSGGDGASLTFVREG